MSTLGLYSEEFNSENVYFWWPVRTKIQHIYQIIFKEVNGYHKYLRFTYIQDNNFEFLRSDIALNKVDLLREETVRAKPT